MPDKDGRAACLAALVADALIADVTGLVLERDASLEMWDRKFLHQELGTKEARARISYRHEAPHSEPLLWIPDAVAWATARGGEWKKRSSGLTVSTHIIRV
jgi:hypothetical protein